MTEIMLVPIALEVEQAFKMKSAYPVNMCAIFFALQALPMTVVAVWAFNKFSVRSVLFVSILCQLTGAWFRMGAFYFD
jgi:hypothetical protein